MTTNDKFERLLILAAADCGKNDVESFKQIDTSDVVFDRRFKRKKYKIIRNYNHRTRYKITNKTIFKVLLILAILFSLAAVATVAVDEWKDSKYEAVIEEYSDHFLIGFAPSGQGGKTTVYTESVVTEEAVTEPYSENSGNATPMETTEENTTEEITEEATTTRPNDVISEFKKPTFIPDGMEEIEMMKNIGFYVLDYYIGDEYCFTYIQSGLANDDIHVDNTNASITTVSINGLTGILVSYSDRPSFNFFWNDDMYIYEILSETLTYEEVIRIAESVK